MVTRSVYIVGGAGVGKSTFTAQLLERLGADLGPQELIRNLPMSNGTGNPISGHPVAPGRGMYLGRMRDAFPGTDGLSRTCGTTGAVWLGEGNLPDYIIGEGATLTTARFLGALAEYTDLLLIHLTAPLEVRLERCAERGSEQKLLFLKGSATRAETAVRKAACPVLEVDTTCEVSWDLGLLRATSHVRLAFPESGR